MIDATYNVSDHYWAVAGSTTQVYHSARRAYVPVADAQYQAWLTAGGIPTRIAVEADLWDVLAAQYPDGLPPGNTTVRDKARDAARELMAKQDTTAQALRVVALLALDNDNRAIAALADLKARMAAAPNTVAGVKAAFSGWSLPAQFTDAQLKQVIHDALGSGRGD